ncbi:MAG TPA: type II toxin-antitoxin system prevent-host-death family antitoxin [Ilumatobacteraceae bacterium]|nr:type II toxin-antitoxin system prevent-host-death family antitoxin [Ilumatobacteraceae bacterium]
MDQTQYVASVHDARSNLSELLRRVERGEEIVITRAGVPVAKLVPFAAKAPREPGRWAGRVVIADDFDRTSDDLVALFESSTGAQQDES